MAFFVTLIPAAMAQQQRSYREEDRPLSRVHLLSRTVGQTVVDSALSTDPSDYVGLDCSHFVNAIFESAGLPFSYANSIQLYKGADEFRRVFHPQPGDLIVWRGHVGIVVDPAEHSFYSMLRSGLRLSSYDSRYWRGRGYSRFFRYASTEPLRRAVRVARLRTTN